jgi:hypothetical protein
MEARVRCASLRKKNLCGVLSVRRTTPRPWDDTTLLEDVPMPATNDKKPEKKRGRGGFSTS